MSESQRILLIPPLVATGCYAGVIHTKTSDAAHSGVYRELEHFPDFSLAFAMAIQN